MKLLAILGIGKHSVEQLPGFIRELQDIRGVRVIRLQGPVSREIAAQADAADEAAERSGAFARPLLFDFKDATECDSVTLGYMIRALRRRMAAQAQVGIINAPPQLVAELEIAKLDRLLHVFASEDQALAELAVLSH